MVTSHDVARTEDVVCQWVKTAQALWLISEGVRYPYITTVRILQRKTPFVTYAERQPYSRVCFDPYYFFSPPPHLRRVSGAELVPPAIKRRRA